jgi:hypothetical protein
MRVGLIFDLKRQRGLKRWGFERQQMGREKVSDWRGKRPKETKIKGIFERLGAANLVCGLRLGSQTCYAV